MTSKQERRKWDQTLEYNGQAFADRFVLNCTNFKTNGYFLELGSRHAKWNNNSYILEKNFGWKGIMVDRVATHKGDYESDRKNSNAIIEDATKINYRKIFEDNNFPLDLDFWQLDLEVRDNTALDTFMKIDEQLLDHYRFATVTMEHDIYTGLQNAINTRTRTREVLKNRGYYCVFSDILDPPEVCVDYPYEDWWVHPDLVDMKYIKQLQEKNKDKYLIVNIGENKIECFKSYDVQYW